MKQRSRRNGAPRAGLLADPSWYKTAVIYEVHIRAFCDSNGDGIGDILGLCSKLDFLQDLGVTAIWLLPFYPSPLRDGGYDIGDYTNIHPNYGTLADFKKLLTEAHARGIRVITELVINHTSTEHAWFQKARRAPPGSAARNFYVWSDNPQRYNQARIIFKDFEASNWSWDPVAKAYYWHRFYAHQPDLNFDNTAVHKAVFDVMDFWLEMGVDGLRLDAVPYLYERDGTNCENLPETHAFLRKLRVHIDEKFKDRMLLAEANQWPVDAAAYFGDGDECHMNFHFPLMPRMFMALQMEDRFPITDILRQTPAIPAASQWATFLRNHDELTLEMVTDEERDYMYRMYTEDPVARINLGIRRRLAPLLRSRRKIELMTSLLFALPGTPVLYYGDEIGMGDNMYLGDRDGVRTPMQWSADRNAGFSRANPQKLYLPVIVDPEYHYESVNVEAQQSNPSSLLWWTKRLIALRKEHPVLGHGDLEVLSPDNAKVLVFTRSHDDQRMLMAANLSRHPQFAEIDLSAYAGFTPVEALGRGRFPIITERPYGLSFGPHGFYWFHLDPPSAAASAPLPQLTVAESWTALLRKPAALAPVLARFVSQRRWFRGKARTQTGARVVDVVEAAADSGRIAFVFLEVEYADGDPEIYLTPLAFAAGEAAVNLQHRLPHAVVCELTVTATPDTTHGLVHDALATGDAARVLMRAIEKKESLGGKQGRLVYTAQKALRSITGLTDLQPHVVELEQSNTTVPLGDRLLLKVFRQAEAGQNSELEIGAFLTEKGGSLAPAVLGTVSYRPTKGEPSAVAVIHDFVPNQGSAWDLFRRELEQSFSAFLSNPEMHKPGTAEHVLDLQGALPSEAVSALAGQSLHHARLLGTRTAGMHSSLASGKEAAFVPEAFTMLHQQSLFQGARAMLVRTLDTLNRAAGRLPEGVQEDLRQLGKAQAAIEERLRGITRHTVEVDRIRCHGDLHLGQVLFTGVDFVIIDFEGEPARPLRERRYKRCALRDVAGMLRSFAYVAEASLRDGRQRAQDAEILRPWAMEWAAWTGAAYVESYLSEVSGAPFIPKGADLRMLVDFYTLEKCIYEIGYEMNNRPDWLSIPVAGLLALAKPGADK